MTTVMQFKERRGVVFVRAFGRLGGSVHSFFTIERCSCQLVNNGGPCSPCQSVQSSISRTICDGFEPELNFRSPPKLPTGPLSHVSPAALPSYPSVLILRTNAVRAREIQLWTKRKPSTGYSTFSHAVFIPSARLHDYRSSHWLHYGFYLEDKRGKR